MRSCCGAHDTAPPEIGELFVIAFTHAPMSERLMKIAAMARRTQKNVLQPLPKPHGRLTWGP